MSIPNTLDIPYWIQRWENNQAQWHLPKANTGMTNNLDKWVGDAKGGRVFFPLCGKSLDMTFMATAGFTVIGSEAAVGAIQAYAKEHDGELVEGSSKFSTPASGEFQVFSFKGHNQPLDVTFLLGDFFAIGKTPIVESEKCQFAFDRGSMVAIHPSLRSEYVKVMDSIMAVGGKTLLYAVEYDQTEMPAPPNSLSIEETKALYSSLPNGEERFTYELLSEDTVSSKFLKANGGPLSHSRDYALLITKKA